MLFGELLPDMLTLIYGKMRKLDVLYAARQDDSTVEDWPTLVEHKKAGKYDEEFNKFKNCLALHLSKNSELDIDNSKKVIEDAMAIYISNSYYSNEYNLRIKMSYVLDCLKLPNWINRKIRLLYWRFFILKEKGNYPAFSDTSNKYYDDFEKIKFHVLSSIEGVKWHNYN